MPLRLMADAGAQTTIPLALTSVATSFVGQSTANFPQPQNVGSGGQSSLTILDSGNPAFNAATPLATPFEYAYYTSNNTGTNTISGMTRGVAGSTPHAFFAGATVAVGLLVEDFYASVPWKFDDQSPTGASIIIPASGTIPTSYLGQSWWKIRITWTGRTNSANTSDILNLTYNGDVAGNYDWTATTLSGNAAPAGATAVANGALRVGVLPGGAAGAGLFNSGWIEINAYTFVANRKALTYQCWRSDSAADLMDIGAGAWRNTSTFIQTITLTPAAGSFVGGSRFVTELGP